MITEAEVRAHLREECGGIFSEDALERHLDDHVGLTLARGQVDMILSRCPYARDVLDVGSGYGSFVLEARQRGLRAIGAEPAPFEVRYARERLRRLRPSDADECVYREVSGLALPFPSASFDVVTLWNVIEHVSDFRGLIDEAVRVLRRGGRLFIVGPNYAAFRREAHYHVLWVPLLPRRAAVHYLRLRGRNARFFVDHVFYCTNWGVLWHLHARGMAVRHLGEHKLEQSEAIRRYALRRLVALARRTKLTGLAVAMLRCSLWNPFRPTIALEAIKAAERQ